MSTPPWYNELDNVREAILELGASCAESYSKWSRGGCGCRRAGCSRCFPAASCRSEGDFLSDVVRLNLSYVSQLARLGSAYSSLATRALDRLYSCYEPAPFDAAPAGSSPCEIRLAGSGDGTLNSALTVANPSSTASKLSFDGLNDGSIVLKLTQIGDATKTFERPLQLRLRGQTPPGEIEIDACNKVRFGVSLDASGLPKDKQYRGSFRAWFGGSAQVIHVLVDVLP